MLGEPVWHIASRARTLETTSHRIGFRSLVIATGAFDRPVAVPGSLLPGVFTAGGTQALAKDGAPVGRRVLVAGSGPFVLPVARELYRCGGAVIEIALSHLPPLALAVLFEPEVVLEGIGYALALARHRVRTSFGWVLAAVHGSQRVEGATLVRLRQQRRVPERRFVECDAVALSYGFLPQLALADIAGCALRFDRMHRTWFIAIDSRLETTVPGIFAAGEVVGIGGHRCAAAEGEMAGRAAARYSGHPTRDPLTSRFCYWRLRRFADAFTPALTPPCIASSVDDRAPVCRCEGVDAGTIRAAVRDGAATVAGVRLRTRCGMGICQGRMCAQLAAELIASTRHEGIEAASRIVAGAPARPVLVSDVMR